MSSPTGLSSFSTGATARRMKLRNASRDDLKREHGRVDNGPLKELVRNPSRRDLGALQIDPLGPPPWTARQTALGMVS